MREVHRPNLCIRLFLSLKEAFQLDKKRIKTKGDNAVIKIDNLKKTYKSHNTEVQALDGVSLDIAKGDIFGVIGFSGAGKSSLIRCINRLEEPDSGTITVGGTEITALNQQDLRHARSKIGMIFQHFNLFDSRTVLQNVAFPLEVAGYPPGRIEERAREIIALVGLSDKTDVYPSQLSGGQKQRVGIARALANGPDVLLCDEATSALDPLTTFSILELLRDLNRKLNLTILLITHELDVLRHICNHMAVIENGRIVETGTVQQLFKNPESETGQRFVQILENFRNTEGFERGEGI